MGKTFRQTNAEFCTQFAHVGVLWTADYHVRDIYVYTVVNAYNPALGLDS